MKKQILLGILAAVVIVLVVFALGQRTFFKPGKQPTVTRPAWLVGKVTKTSASLIYLVQPSTIQFQGRTVPNFQNRIVHVDSATKIFKSQGQTSTSATVNDLVVGSQVRVWVKVDPGSSLDVFADQIQIIK